MIVSWNFYFFKSNIYQLLSPNSLGQFPDDFESSQLQIQNLDCGQYERSKINDTQFQDNGLWGRRKGYVQRRDLWLRDHPFEEFLLQIRNRKVAKKDSTALNSAGVGARSKTACVRPILVSSGYNRINRWSMTKVEDHLVAPYIRLSPCVLLIDLYSLMFAKNSLISRKEFINLSTLEINGTNSSDLQSAFTARFNRWEAQPTKGMIHS